METEITASGVMETVTETGTMASDVTETVLMETEMAASDVTETVRTETETMASDVTEIALTAETGMALTRMAEETTEETTEDRAAMAISETAAVIILLRTLILRAEWVMQERFVRLKSREAVRERTA